MSTYTPTWTRNVATVAQKCPTCGGQINDLCLSDLPLFDSTLSPPHCLHSSPHLLFPSFNPLLFSVFPPLSLSLSFSLRSCWYVTFIPGCKATVAPSPGVRLIFAKASLKWLGGTTERASWGSSECDQLLTPAVKGAVCVWKRHSGRGQLCESSLSLC